MTQVSVIAEGLGAACPLELKRIGSVLDTKHSDCREFESRKVVTRTSDDVVFTGEFNAMYFVQWLFDGSVAACTMHFPDSGLLRLSGVDLAVLLSEGPVRHRGVDTASIHLIARSDIAFLFESGRLEFDPTEKCPKPEDLSDRLVRDRLADSDTLERKVWVTPRSRMSPSHLFRNLRGIGDGLEVAESRIPGAGRGLFATVNIPPGKLVTAYFGHVFSEKLRQSMRSWPADKRPGSHAMPVLRKLVYLDGVKSAMRGMYCAHFANSDDGSVESKSMVNCQFLHIALDWEASEESSKTPEATKGTSSQRPWRSCISGTVVVLASTKAIQSGDELYVSYGKKFWCDCDSSPLPIPKSIKRSRSSSER